MKFMLLLAVLLPATFGVPYGPNEDVHVLKHAGISEAELSPQHVESVICPDGSSECPDGNTCCKLSTGQWGCCPLPNAVCCSDGLHCCPSGYTCDTSAGTCTRGNDVMTWYEKTPSREVGVEVVCPGGTAQCPTGNTCCRLSTGQWGCCPLPNAVCCSDGLHCCPSGYTCVVSTGTCTRGNEVISWIEKSVANPIKVESVICPDGSSECPDGNTCCKLSTGQWGCCPLPNAVCCSDDLHCCPSGYTCDTSAGTCTRGNDVLTWYEKTPSREVGVEVVCPGGTAQCPTGNTCCRLSTGQWGCCPLPNAVCCSDGLHCCPSGYTCVVSTGTCTRGNEVISWTDKSVANPIMVESVICPDGSSECPDGNTCCRLSTGQWGCCPLPNAVCCSDGLHCCPNGYTCDTSAGTCTRGNDILAWFEKTPSREVGVEVVCPGGTAQCPTGNTCCRLSTGQWGCCPLPNAVCCSDGLHCCPSGYTCVVSTGTCTRGNEVISWTDKSVANPIMVESVICPDGSSECPDGNTCCRLSTGQWGCCPLPNAVCCSDGLHCCPNGYTCDTSAGTCTRGNDILAWFEKTPSREVGVEVVCPGGTAQCPTGNTCCRLSTGQWGCCPLPNAVCCSDGLHCCPSGYTCVVSTGTCTRGNEVISWIEKSVANPIKVESVICPDGSSECPDGNTCCKLSTGQWGCCPLPNAVCCSDGLHCCPNGYTCDTSAGTCTRGNDVMTWYEKTPSREVGVEVVCPGGTAQCPTGNTCCRLSTGQWGCCPLPNAVCCSDGLHCCPSGYTCVVSTGTCTRGNEVISWSEKSVANPIKVESVICPDGSSECPDGNTCCKLSTGQWGCCPLPNAVCCSDGLHCCPNGYTCDTSAGTCTRGNDILTWFEKTPSREVGVEVVCPGGTAQCPTGNTCCRLSTGQWGCCPLPNAVCCSDGLHCCPSGYTCVVSTGTCTRGNEVISWTDKSVANPIKVESVICPDGSSECPDGNTCCRLSTGQWGCCPLPNAVCCSDGLHCCPNGYTCDTSAGTCTRGNDILAWFEKTPSREVGVEVVCPGGTAQCPTGNTCCRLSTGQWGCCPLPNAVCCSDGLHCCPSGYTCVVSTGTCTRGNEVISWIEKSVANPIKVESVICPDGSSECPDGNTCCKLSTGQWGCCPLPNAVCCSDGLHCCPNGYTCDTSAGTCTRGNDVMTWYEKTPSREVGVEVVCPGGTAQCPTGNTCCRLSTGQWGCCPLPNAVCCSDGLHCCPSGYTCVVSTGTCTRGNEVISWSEKSVANPIKVESVICPDGSSECPDGNTCCKLSTGQWGCCPLPNAVCCSDGLHCCPNGYTCDTSAGTCTRGNDILTWFEKTPSREVGVEVVCPGGTAQCPTGNTCCRLSTGQWGCCPLPNAVCCSDGLHCCPSGYTCVVSTGTCTRGNEVISWTDKSVANPIMVESVICPDGSSECPDGNTCCRLSTGQWGCCPLPNAVCCSDGLHCCPNGYTCDTSAGTCTRGNDILAWFEKTPSREVGVGVVCPGGTAQCPTGNTCCRLSTGQWGCCPLPNAVCCSDGLHCCPSGYTCVVSTGTCTRGNEVISWIEKSVANPIKVESVICPDGSSECPDGNTCCKLSTGQWGCCPLPNAVCCSDGLHCCPNGYTCDTSAGTCTRGNDILAWFEKTPSREVGVEVVCPGGTAQCPTGNTCCRLSTGQWGCCPLPNAVCCSDGLHCCPSGYTCVVSTGTCTRGNEVISWTDKSVANPIKVESVICPDGSSECPDGNTCCKLSTGQWGCCPLPNAVCCSDGLHCCPSGYTCDTSAGTCTRGNDVMTWFKKSVAAPVSLESVNCPDGITKCPENNTCCKLSTGQYGCCPLPNAVCCSDDLHCCPSGYTCDTSAGTCTRGNDVLAWFEKTPSREVGVEVVCPGGTAQCPTGNTCCRLSTGQWGCCPLPNAVCCSDGLHCCPSGYTCVVSTGTCTRGNEVISWTDKSVANPIKVESVICPDGSSECPDGNTCCKLSTGQWGCCPLPNAVCCSDGLHCCPSGYTCDTSAGTCTKGNAIPMMISVISPASVQENSHLQVKQVEDQGPSSQGAKHLLFEPEEPEAGVVVCPDGSSQCPDGNTCCKLVSGQWGCCPLPQAVCCADMLHCCPSGYKCDTASSTCTKGLNRLPWLTKRPSTKLVASSKPKDTVTCPDQVSTCPESSTCCQTPGGIYGCCPYPAAICCADLIHCCPSGYTCQTSTGTCTKGEHRMPWQLKLPTI
ncbi:uncharacterized protein [Diadema antillarum]|uniref:uncharacterized protein isoform X3 n=1 Tax=Diadema antillarum TaxID=105358 RepID=UPI003A86A14A